MRKYKICVYAICKNEVAFVDRWMDSMNEADLVVVTDTGSTDGTVERLRERGATVYVDEIKPWRFDVARNVSLDHVPTDMDICVCTDLDEVLLPGWREKLEAAWGEDVVHGKYLYNWHILPDGTPDVQFTYFKIHTRENFKWVYPIHEIIQYVGEKPYRDVYINGLVLNHYPDNTKSRGSYLTLLEMAAEENPEDDRMVYYLGREYMYKAKWEKCIETLKKHLKLKTATWKEERCASMRWIATSYQALNNKQEAYNWYYRAIAELPTMREAYVECARMAYNLQDWPTVYYMSTEALKITKKSDCYINLGFAWDFTPDDLASISSYFLGMYDSAYKHAKRACEFAPDDERLKNNLRLAEAKVKEIQEKKQEKDVKKDESKPERKADIPKEVKVLEIPKQTPNETEVVEVNSDKRLVHTLLCLFRETNLVEDIELALTCMKSLEKSSYKTVVVHNQGCLSNEELTEFFSQFKLDIVVIGSNTNSGTVVGRQNCFEYIWEKYPETEYISEIHLDMIFTDNWEDALIAYLETHNEPIISCGIVDQEGILKFINRKVTLMDKKSSEFAAFLKSLTCNEVVKGFANPCIHVSKILKETGGYNAQFLTRKQCYEDDSMLLGYYYYYGTKEQWYPKVNYNSVVYHAVAGQRLNLIDNVNINYYGLVKQYGAMGLKHLSELHSSSWQVNFFGSQYQNIIKEISEQ